MTDQSEATSGSDSEANMMLWTQELVKFMRSRGWSVDEATRVASCASSELILAQVCGGPPGQLTENEYLSFRAACMCFGSVMMASLDPKLIPPSMSSLAEQDEARANAVFTHLQGGGT